MRDTWGNRTALRWTRPSLWRREFELRSGEQLVATMKVRGAIRPVAVFECGDDVWTIARTGFFRNRATIRASGQSTDVAEFRASAWNSAGELTFASGARFWLGANFWATRFDVRTSAGEPILSIHKRGLCGKSADVEIVPAARSVPGLPILAAFGWFLSVMHEQDSGVVVLFAS